MVERIGLRLYSATWIIYLGYMGLISLGLFLMTGVVGLSASIYFNKIMFASIVSDKGFLRPASTSTSALVPPPTPKLQARNSHHRSNMVKEYLATAIVLVVLFSPVVYYPDHPGDDDGYLYQLKDTAEEYRRTHNSYGLVSLVLAYYETHVLAITAMLWAIISAFTIYVKRRSAMPGGKIYKYNQRKVHQVLSERRRQLRDILRDPILLVDMQRRYGDLTSLLEIIADWEAHGYR